MSDKWEALTPVWDITSQTIITIQQQISFHLLCHLSTKNMHMIQKFVMYRCMHFLLDNGI